MENTQLTIMKKIISILVTFFICVSISAQVQFGSGTASFTGQSAQTATVNNIIPATVSSTGTNVNGYSYGAVQIISTGTGGTFIFEMGMADGNYVTMTVYNSATLTGTPITAAITATSSNLIYYFPIVTNYIRVRIATTITGGSIQALTKLTRSPFSPAVMQVAQATAANLNVTPASTPLMTGLIASAAAADATANPTGAATRNYGMIWNGSTWDRGPYGTGFNTTTGDAGAKTATGNGATQTNTGYKGVNLFIILGTVSGTTPTCVFKLQGSVDGGTNWYDIPGATTASLTASTNVGIQAYPGLPTLAGSTTTGTTATISAVLPRSWRVVWTIGGTTPSFTITSISYNAIP